MYLSMLSTEKKELFLDLALTIVYADGDYSNEEKVVLESYCQEMNIDFERDKPTLPLNKLLDKIAKITNIQEKKIIVFESIGLSMADNDFDGNERKIIHLMSLYFCLDEDFLSNCETIIGEYMLLQNRINNLIT